MTEQAEQTEQMTYRLRPVASTLVTAEALRVGGDEFFGIELRRHTAATLLNRLEFLGLRLVVAEVDGVVTGRAGYTLNRLNRQQATVSVVVAEASEAPQLVRSLLYLLHTTAAVRSFVTVCRAGSRQVEIYTEAGFTEVGRLRGRRHRDHELHDDVVLHRTVDDGSDRP